MPVTNRTADTPPMALLHALAAFEPDGADVVSLYLDLRADANGQDNYDLFLKRRVAQLSGAEPAGSPPAGVVRAFERIQSFLANEIAPSANGAAIFTTTGDGDFFEALAIDVPLGAHQMFVGPVPHLYSLVRVIDQYPRYAALLLDSHQARIIVFGFGAVEARAEVTGEKTRRHSMGGWSQARYQRRIDNIQLQHIKEVVDALGTVVRDEAIDRIIVAGDAGIVARLREQLPDALAGKLTDVLRWDRHAAEDEIIDEALAALRRKDAESDAERVAEVLDAWRAGGLGVAGPEATLQALQLGQVDELLVVAAPAVLKPVQRLPDEAGASPVVTESASGDGARPTQAHLADVLVTKATQTGASVRIIEDAELLRAHGGVAAALRFRI